MDWKAWRKKQRQPIMIAAFALIILGFCCAYQGGMRELEGLIYASFCLDALAVGAIFLARK